MTKVTVRDPERCPHCGVPTARAERRNEKARDWTCSNCGGPRLPPNANSPNGITPLKEAHASQLAARRLGLSALFLSLATLFITLFGIAAAPMGGASRIILLLAEVMPLVLALRSRRRASRLHRKAREAMDRAWLAAAEDIARERDHGVTVAELAKRLEVDPVRAEALLTELAVHDRARIDVDDDAEVRYSIGPAATPSPPAARVRVAGAEPRLRAPSEGEELRSIELDEATERALLSDPFPNSRRR